MKRWKSLVYFLLLNVLVSAGTIYAVLVAWDRSHPPLVRGVSSTLAMASEPGAEEGAVGGTPAPALTEETHLPTATVAYIIHYVEPGDDFENIAARYGVTVEDLVAANGFSASQPLGDGEMLRVPVTPTPAAQPEVTIESVGAPGDLELESVMIVQQGEGVLSLEGWQLDNGNGMVFTFPALELATDGARVSVYTKAGANTVGKLHWGLGAPVWGSGSVVTLRDAQGGERATFTVP